VVDLKTGKLFPHDRRLLLSKISPVEYPLKAGVDCPLWLDSLHKIFAGDDELVSFPVQHFRVVLWNAARRFDRVPRFHRQASLVVSAGEVTMYWCLLFLVTVAIRVVQGKLFQGGQFTFNAIEPGRIRGCEIQADAMLASPGCDLGLNMGRIIIEYDVQRLSAVTATQPPEEGQELPPRFVGLEAADQSIALQAIGRQEVADTALPMVGGPVALHGLARSSPTVAGT
jgi:D5 N terminal like